MKKILLPILLFVMFMPFMIDAKEYCKVVDGDGKSIGSEIACGTEHFYIIDSNEDEIKTLAKYNLNVGKTIYKEKIKKEVGDSRSDYQYCQDLATSRNGEVKSDDFYNAPGYCFYTTNTINYRDPEKNPIIIYKMPDDTRSDEEYCQNEVGKIEGAIFEEVRITQYYPYCYFSYQNYPIAQLEAAKSAHWDENLNYIYPQVGDVYISPVTRASDRVKKYEELDSKVNFYDYDMNFGFSSSSELYHDPYTILQIYKNELESSNFTIKEINMLSISELDKIINTISQKSLPLKEWGDNLEIVQGQYENNGILYGTEIHFGDLKPYIPNNYKWLYSTTYWNSTAYKLPDNSSVAVPKNYYVFTAEQGKLCGAGFALCAPETALGCGIRPVITIPNELQYLIKTETDKNGSIEVVENSLGGEEIQFKVSAKKGYKLGSIVIKTDSGEEVEFNEGEITKNDDGTFSINKNKFTMPFENVTIQAKFELENILKNPETGNKILLITLILVASIGIGTFIYKRKESRYNI